MRRISATGVTNVPEPIVIDLFNNTTADDSALFEVLPDTEVEAIVASASVELLPFNSSMYKVFCALVGINNGDENFIQEILKPIIHNSIGTK
jgi:hypothetical protein